ncbi:MAG TPA: RNA-binding S4 domain-containing protein [Stellaceae bacterium]|nr:RNA-binding S4 domain-containing protein [Stellaceae bacterium]
MAPTPPAVTQRLDRWLWCARFAKSRSLAARLCTGERVLIGDTLVQKAHYALRVGDRLTVRLGRTERRIEVLALAERRGPASEARKLYVETAPPTALVERAEAWSPLLAADEDELGAKSE